MQTHWTNLKLTELPALSKMLCTMSPTQEELKNVLDSELKIYIVDRVDRGAEGEDGEEGELV